MEPMRLLVTDAAAQPPRQATAWLITTLGIRTNIKPTPPNIETRSKFHQPEIIQSHQPEE
jgi:hypothetical protein